MGEAPSQDTHLLLRLREWGGSAAASSTPGERGDSRGVRAGEAGVASLALVGWEEAWGQRRGHLAAWASGSLQGRPRAADGNSSPYFEGRNKAESVKDTGGTLSLRCMCT